MHNLLDFISSILGNAKNYNTHGCWYEYNCPVCSEENGGVADGKYNLAIRVSHNGSLWGHCWKCGYSGKLSKIIKDNGSVNDYEYFKGLVRNLEFENENDETLVKFDDVVFPDGFKLLDDSFYGKMAYEYLKNRGVSDSIIEKHNIGYVMSNDWLNNKVLIPSYDIYGDLNYWVARDFTNKSKYKIVNAKERKEDIVFNERFVNWYEPITLVEGPFDHIVTPNSIPLLGKTLKEDSFLYRSLYDKSHCLINIMLDSDAEGNVSKIYKLLNSGRLNGKIRVVTLEDGYDPSDYYRDFGPKAVMRKINNGVKLKYYLS